MDQQDLVTPTSAGHVMPRNPDGTFTKGIRVKRGIAEDTSVLRDAIVLAASWAGQGSVVRYLYGVAKKHPVAFCGLLARVVPLQIDTKAAVTVRHIITGVPRPGDPELPEQLVIEGQPETRAETRTDEQPAQDSPIISDT